MIFPYAHEDIKSRRWPFVTGGLVLVCFLIHVWVTIQMNDASKRVQAIAEQAVELYQAHPYLETKAPLDRVLKNVRPTTNIILRPSAAKRAEEQADLDEMNDSIVAIVQNTPLMRFGYVPVKNNVLGLITYQFFHEGWLHLLFNMWFLLLCGINLEDRWGRATFAGFYLAAGVVAALGFKLFAGPLAVPLIGASGAIAGAMGAFLILFARTRIRLFYILAFRWGTFKAPAYLMLPLWLADQFVEAYLDYVRGAQGGVAYVAHIVGFLFGVAFALVLRKTGVERRLDRAVEGTISVLEDPALARAAELMEASRPKEAIPVLEAFIAKNPESIDAQLEMLRATKAAGDKFREIRAYTRLVSLYLGAGHAETALDLYLETRGLGMHREIPPALRRRLAAGVAKTSRAAEAVVVYEDLLEGGLQDENAVRVAMECADHLAALRSLDRARELYEAVRTSPFSTVEIDARVAERMAAIAPAPTSYYPQQ